MRKKAIRLLTLLLAAVMLVGCGAGDAGSLSGGRDAAEQLRGGRGGTAGRIYRCAGL